MRVTDSPTAPSAPAAATTAAERRDAYLCFCEEVTAEAFRAHISTHPGRSFEAVCADLRVATKCTACLLNAENIFVEAARQAPVALGSFRVGGTRPRLRGLRRLYALIDALSPSIARTVPGIIPIIAGPGVKTILAFANIVPPVIGDRAPPFALKVETRDADGRVVSRQRGVVERDGRTEFEISKGIEVTKRGELATGACFLSYRALESGGFLGCIRPHFTVETDVAASSVHSAAGGSRRCFIEARAVNPDERLYVSAVNCTDRPAELHVSTTVDGIACATGSWAVPARGASLCPVPNVPQDGKVFGVVGRADRDMRWHFVVSEGDPPRISVDHI